MEDKLNKYKNTMENRELKEITLNFTLLLKYYDDNKNGVNISQIENDINLIKKLLCNLNKDKIT